MLNVSACYQVHSLVKGPFPLIGCCLAEKIIQRVIHLFSYFNNNLVEIFNTWFLDCFQFSVDKCI